MRTTLLTIAIATIAPLAFAQDRTATAAQDSSTQVSTPAGTDAEQSTGPRRSIKVLQHPYDLAGFYRSGGSAPEGWAGLTNDPSYGIASFYRSQQGGRSSRYGWSAFWTSGYSAPRPAPFLAYRRTIGENGDLFLMVPYLAPVGPITGAFFGY